MADILVVEETLKRISSHKGIFGVVILNGDGIPLRTTLDNTLSVQYAALVDYSLLYASYSRQTFVCTPSDVQLYCRLADSCPEHAA